MLQGPVTLALLAIALLTLAGCSINTLVANALTGGDAGTVFSGDEDPELVGSAIPFALKMYETLLFSTPGHQGLMLTTGSMFVMYANAFVHGPADMMGNEQWQEREEALARAKRLYLRGHEILMDAVRQKYPGFSAAAETEDGLADFLRRFRKPDVPLLYWTVASGLAAYSVDVFDFDLSANIPAWHQMILRAYELDPDFGGSTLDEFLLLYYASVPEMLGGDPELARKHFDLAMEKSGGGSTGALISYARSISVPEQDYERFRDLLERALAVDPNDNPENRLVIILDQRRARWLLENARDFFAFLP